MGFWFFRVAGPPHFGQGGDWSHPNFLSVFLLLLLFLIYGQNDVVLGWVGVVVLESGVKLTLQKVP